MFPARLSGTMLASLVGFALGTGCSPEDPPGTPHNAADQGETQPTDETAHTVIAVRTAKQFEKHVVNANAPVLVDFYATWCPPCETLAPVIASLATEYKGRIAFVKVDVDEARDLATQHNVEAMPTLALFANGKKVKHLVGARSKSELKAELDSLLTR